jgi:folate-dependent phosphoribosylglycinamide formyltransferase PurN
VLDIGWFTTARDQAAIDLLDAVLRGVHGNLLEVRIRYVFCNGSDEHPRVRELEARASREGLPLVNLPYRTFESQLRTQGRKNPEVLTSWRIRYDNAVMERIGSFPVDLAVLAGYMLITGPEMCRRIPMINLHPALPGGPAGSWQEVIRALIADRSSESGVMVHRVTEELDAGPTITYCRFPIRGEGFEALWEALEDGPLAATRGRELDGTDLFAEIRRQGFQREIPLLLTTLKELGEGTLRLQGQRIVYKDHPLRGGLDLTSEVEAFLDRTEGT